MRIPAQLFSEIHSSMSDDIRNAAQVHFLNHKHSRHEEIYAMKDEIVHSLNHRHETNKARCYVLAKAFNNYKYGYTRSMVTVYTYSALSLDGAVYASAVHNMQGKKFLKAGFCVLLLYGLHRCRSM